MRCRLQIIIGILACSGGFFSSPRAIAHPRLVASRPEAQDNVLGPAKRIELRFSERLEEEFHTVAITAQDGKPAKVYRLEADSVNPTVLVIFCEPLPGGQYHVLWGACA
jgi:methionine-rich copper-binding protein CopC